MSANAKTELAVLDDGFTVTAGHDLNGPTVWRLTTSTPPTWTKLQKDDVASGGPVVVCQQTSSPITLQVKNSKYHNFTGQGGDDPFPIPPPPPPPNAMSFTDLRDWLSGQITDGNWLIHG